ncbi:MAG: YggS family pyridoxal phosphate-dependent enzyme [Acidobacteriaceae bacterium]
MSIAENLERIHAHIADVCSRTGRRADEVKLMAVSKVHPVAAIVEAYAAGQRLFGENKVQEFQQKSAELGDLEDLEVHLIGPLQSNKSAKAVQCFHAIDTLDSLRLAQRLNDAAMTLDKKLPVLLEIKLSHEESKHGLLPGSAELDALLERLPDFGHLQLRGLMTVPPYSEDLEAVRPYFRQLREMRDTLAAQRPNLSLEELSMGMSHDFPVAIEEGSTCVRIGTAIFGKRVYPV